MSQQVGFARFPTVSGICTVMSVLQPGTLVRNTPSRQQNKSKFNQVILTKVFSKCCVTAKKGEAS